VSGTSGSPLPGDPLSVCVSYDRSVDVKNPTAEAREGAGRLIASLLGRSDVVIIDTETTGIRQAEVIELAAIDTSGKVLFDQMIRPRRMEMNRYAERVHGISLQELADKPTLPEVLDELDAVLESSLVLAWNASFDCLMIQRSRAAWGLPEQSIQYRCAMKVYARLHGRRSMGLHNAIVAAGLAEALNRHKNHRALGDANLVLELLTETIRDRRSSLSNPAAPPSPALP